MRQNVNQTTIDKSKDLKLLNMLVATTAAFAICFLAPAMTYFTKGSNDTVNAGDEKQFLVILFKLI